MLIARPELSDDEIRAFTALASVDVASAESVPYKTVRLIPTLAVQTSISPALQAVSECLESHAHVLRAATDEVGAIRGRLRRLAVAQIGSRNHLDDEQFAGALARFAIATAVPAALRAAASTWPGDEQRQRIMEAAWRCEQEPSAENARAASDEADAAWKAGKTRHQQASAMAAGVAAFRASTAAGMTRVAFSAEWRASKAASVLIETLRAEGAARESDEEASREDRRGQIACGFLDGAVEILTDLDAPGVQLLWLAEDKVVRNMAPDAVHQAGLALHEVLGEVTKVPQRVLPPQSAALAEADQVRRLAEGSQAYREADLIEMSGALARLTPVLGEWASADQSGCALIEQAHAVLEREAPSGTLARWIEEQLDFEPAGKAQGLMMELRRREKLNGGERHWRAWARGPAPAVADAEIDDEQTQGISR